MKQGTYVGSDERLAGKTALVEEVDERTVRVQFDDTDLVELAYGWHEFDRDDWEIS